LEQNLKQATDLADKASKSVTKLHVVETPHFLIFSGWDRGGDRELSEASEAMYKMLCTQFDIPAKQNIFAGKCPVYVFPKEAQFVKFTNEVDETHNAKAAGYEWQNGTGFCYIVMNGEGNKKRFFEVFTHESTHAFVGRYITNRAIPRWTNEGLADLVAGTLVRGAQASGRYGDAEKEAFKTGKDVEHVFQDMGLDAFDYGIAQSFVRYLIARDRLGFIKFVTLIKQGEGEDDALKAAFDLTREEMLHAWAQAVAKRYRR
jgi:hypothetical protein